MPRRKYRLYNEKETQKQALGGFKESARSNIKYATQQINKWKKVKAYQKRRLKMLMK